MTWIEMVKEAQSKGLRYIREIQEYIKNKYGLEDNDLNVYNAFQELDGDAPSLVDSWVKFHEE